jgi:regulator of protease activity HflC (stomatin/prohibitin superfamily)
MPQGMVLIVGLFIILLVSAIKIVKEYQRVVIFRFGKFVGTRGPGIVIIIPFIERVERRVSIRTEVIDVPTQEMVTRDRVPVKVDAVIFFRVLDPMKSVIEIRDYLYGTTQYAQTTLRGIVGKNEFIELITNRDKINAELQKIIDDHTDPWGIKVSGVEVKNVDYTQPELRRALAKKAEADIEREAKIIHADGEYLAAQRLTDAANIMSTNPMSMQLRFLQSLIEVAAENNSTTIFPVPIDLFKPFIEASMKKEDDRNILTKKDINDLKKEAEAIMKKGEVAKKE